MACARSVNLGVELGAVRGTEEDPVAPGRISLFKLVTDADRCRAAAEALRTRPHPGLAVSF